MIIRTITLLRPNHIDLNVLDNVSAFHSQAITLNLPVKGDAMQEIVLQVPVKTSWGGTDYVEVAKLLVVFQDPNSADEDRPK